MDLIISHYIKVLAGNSLAISTYGQMFLHPSFPDFTDKSFFTGSLPITFRQQYKFDITAPRWQNQSSPHLGQKQAMRSGLTSRPGLPGFRPLNPAWGLAAEETALGQLQRLPSQMRPGSLGVTEHAEPGTRALARRG